VSGGLESLLDQVRKAQLATVQEIADSLALRLAEPVLLGLGVALVGLKGNRLKALGEGIVSVDVLLESCLHFSL